MPYHFEILLISAAIGTNVRKSPNGIKHLNQETLDANIFKQELFQDRDTIQIYNWMHLRNLDIKQKFKGAIPVNF